MQQEIFSITKVECSGREENGEGYKLALSKPVDALVTAFKDGAQRVACPLLEGNERCSAGPAPIERQEVYPYRAFVKKST